MRVEDAGARTWLLAAAAGWGLLVWLLAVFGMGSRIAPLPSDPSLEKPIPALPARTSNRLGPIEQYAEIGARPLFAEDRRPKPFSLQGEDEGTNASQEFDSLLTSVLITPNLKLAILQPPDGSKSERVKLGEASESHPSWRLIALNERSAVFDGPGGQRTIELRVFDGTGGQPPTAIAREGEPRVDVPIATPTPGRSTGMPTSQPKPSQPSSGAPATAVAPPGATKPSPPASPQTLPMTEQAQMEAIRQRIQARRALMRQQAQPPQPPAKDQ
ncbi:MAG: type II secretion system protein XpsN [Lysobacter sp.]